MLRGSFRPWGPLPWVLDHLQANDYSIIGALATEQRCLAAWNVVLRSGSPPRQLMFAIEDEPSRYSERGKEKLDKRLQEFLAEGGKTEDIRTFYLFDRSNAFIEATRDFMGEAGENVIIDISCLPKRFFFPVVKLFLVAQYAKNVIATYTVPEAYSNTRPTDPQPLAEDPDPWQPLPSFMPTYPEPKLEPEQKLSLIGVGYDLLGLPSMLAEEGFRGTPVKLLFPFPSPPPGIQKNLEFVRQLEQQVLGVNNYETVLINVYNVSEAFDRILSLTNQGQRYVTLAPYGPKTLSLAMCLYAVSSKVGTSPPAVYYTQPRVYNPDYSIGVAMVSGKPRIYAYCLRINGVNLY